MAFNHSPSTSTTTTITISSATPLDTRNDCFAALFSDRNVTPVYDDVNHYVGCSLIQDTKQGHRWAATADAHAPRLGGSAEANIDYYSGHASIRFQGEAASGLEGILSGLKDSGSVLQKYGTLRDGLTAIILVKPNALAINQSVFEYQRGFGGGVEFGLQMTSANKWNLPCRYFDGKDNTNAQHTFNILDSGTNVDLRWQLITIAVKYNWTNGSDSGKGYINKNGSQIAFLDPIFIGKTANTSWSGDSSGFYFGAQQDGTQGSGRSFGQFSFRGAYFFTSYIEPADVTVLEDAVLERMQA
jgi:hypothetical protein